MKKDRIEKFRKTVWNFYKENKRSFPWRNTKDPYHILISEVMLQQTQADRVTPFYKRFIKKFPNFSVLSKANFSQIYPYWQGLGYNRRALALKKLAEIVVKKYQEHLPKDILLLEDLPGIGPYTARAVSIFSFNTPIACIETNIRRVFIHHFFIQKNNIEDKEILKIAELALDENNSREWHWALMDYGAYLKTQVPNPNRSHKNYIIQSRFNGSLRQSRGIILKILSAEKKSLVDLIITTSHSKKRLEKALFQLMNEGFVGFNKKTKSYFLN